MDCPTVLFGEQVAKLAPNQQYYSYRLMANPGDAHPTWKGVGHGTDLGYLFNQNWYHGNVAALKLSNDMIRAWTSFAKTGKPGLLGATHQWESAFVEATNPVTRYMFLDPANYHMVSNYFRDRCDQFWKQILFA